MKKVLTAALLSAASFSASAGFSAAFMPVGVQNDIALDTVTNTWGWTQLYRGDYNVDSIAVDTMFQGHGDYIMIGGINSQLNTIDVLAAVSWSDFITYTARSETHLANGAQWYNNGGSLGFAGLNDTILQNEADESGDTERDRLSWHTDAGAYIGEYDALALNIRYGWRSGDNLWLNGPSATGWDRVVFTDAVVATITNVPEATHLSLLMAGLVGFGLSRKKFKVPAVRYNATIAV